MDVDGYIYFSISVWDAVVWDCWMGEMVGAFLCMCVCACVVFGAMIE